MIESQESESPANDDISVAKDEISGNEDVPTDHNDSTTANNDAPAPNSDATKLKMDPTADKFVMTADLFSRLTADQLRYTKELNRLTIKSYQPTIVRNLIVLHGAAKSSVKAAEAARIRSLGIKDGTGKVKGAPKWFCKKISQLLTARYVF